MPYNLKCPYSHSSLQDIRTRVLLNRRQEGLLPQKERATPYVSQNLINCRNKLYCKSIKNRSNELEYHCGRRTSSKRVCVKPRRDDCGKCQQALPSTSFVDNTIDSPWRNFLSSELGTKFHWEVSLFLEVPEFP